MAEKRRRQPGFYLVLSSILLLLLTGHRSGLTGSLRMIEVFTASDVPVTVSPSEIRRLNVQFIYFVLDDSQRIEKLLSHELSANASLARVQVIQRVNKSGILKKVMLAYQGVLKAQIYELSKYPAIVFNGKSVVYGVRDVHNAILIYRKKHGQ